MNRENIKKWVDALRYGDYKQVTGSLKSNDRYCCLGVACDLYSQETGLGSWQAAPGGTEYTFVVGDKSASSQLPYAVSEWLGLSEIDPVLSAQSPEGESATYLNDNEGFNFEEIADAIEHTYLQ